MQNRFRRHLLALAALMLAGSPPLQAQTKYWTTQGPDQGLGGSGTWSSSVLVPRAWSTASGGATAANPPTFWTDHHSASFAGLAGTVGIDGNVYAQAVQVGSSGYVFNGPGELHLGRPGTVGGINVAPGVVATVNARVRGDHLSGGVGEWTLGGQGVLQMGQTVAPSTAQRVKVSDAALRPTTFAALNNTEVILDTAAAALDLSAVGSVHLANFSVAAGGVVSLGSSYLRSTGFSSGATASEFISQGSLLGTAQSTLSITNAVGQTWSGPTSVSSFGTLHLTSNGRLKLDQGASFTLLASTDPQRAEGRSLFVGIGGHLVVDNGSTLTAFNGQRIESTGQVSVLGGSQMKVLRGTSLAHLHVGVNGMSSTLTSQLNVSGAGSRLSVEDRVHLGGTVQGVLAVGDGAQVTAPVLTTSNGRLVLNGGTASFARFDTAPGYGFHGTLEFNGGVLNIGDDALATSSLSTPGAAQSFIGIVTGNSGRINKLGSGTLTMDVSAGDFRGQLDIQGGRLTVQGSAFANAAFTGGAGTTLGSVGAHLRVGSLAGDFDVVPGTGGGTLRLGGAGAPATWAGVVQGGSTSVVRTSPGFTQTLQGRASQAFVAPSLQVTAGSVRLSSNTFHFTNTQEEPLATDSSLYVSGGAASVAIADGARVQVGSGARVSGDGSLAVQGAGTRLDVLPRIAGSLSQLFVTSGGRMTISEGAAVKADRLSVGAPAVVTVDRASLNVQGLDIAANGTLALSDLAGSDPATLRTALTVSPADPAGLLSLAGVVNGPSGAGGVTFAGMAGMQLSLTDGGRFTGHLVAEGGLRLNVAGPAAARTLVARGGSTIGFSGSFDATGKTLRTATGGGFDYGGATLIGGTLRGSGHKAGTAAALDGSTLAANASLTASAALTLRNASVYGQLSAAAPLTVDGALIGTGGVLRVAGAANLSDVANQGEIQALAGAHLNLADTLASGGGGRITVASGARVDGAELTLNGALLVNNGIVDSSLTINYGGKAKGAGSFGSVAVNDGGVFAPGNSPGLVQTSAATFGAGGSYEVEVQDAMGGAGTGFDQWLVSGLASFEAGTTPNAVFTFKLVSLGANGLAGAPLNFDAAQAHQWRVLMAGSVQGWTPEEVALDTSAFDAAAPGKFSLAWTTLGGGAQALDIVYAPVPEPHSMALLLAGLGLLRLRRKG